MRNYQVFYWIKANKKEYLNHMFVTAKNAREACTVCKEVVKNQTGRNAFRPTTKLPDLAGYRGNKNFVVD